MTQVMPVMHSCKLMRKGISEGHAVMGEQGGGAPAELPAVQGIADAGDVGCRRTWDIPVIVLCGHVCLVQLYEVGPAVLPTPAQPEISMCVRHIVCEDQSSAAWQPPHVSPPTHIDPSPKSTVCEGANLSGIFVAIVITHCWPEELTVNDTSKIFCPAAAVHLFWVPTSEEERSRMKSAALMP